MNLVRREKPTQGILWTETRLDSGKNRGTGQFAVRLEPGAFQERAMIATVSHAGTVNVAVSIRLPQRQVVVLIGDSTQSSEVLRKAFKLPATLPNGPNPHDIQVEFAGWKITDLLLDGAPLSDDPQAGNGPL